MSKAALILLRTFFGVNVAVVNKSEAVGEEIWWYIREFFRSIATTVNLSRLIRKLWNTILKTVSENVLIYKWEDAKVNGF